MTVKKIIFLIYKLPLEIRKKNTTRTIFTMGKGYERTLHIHIHAHTCAHIQLQVYVNENMKLK